MGRRSLAIFAVGSLDDPAECHLQIGQFMKTSRPLAIQLPASGVVFAESAHAQDFLMPARTDPYHKLIYVLRGGVHYTEQERSPEPALAGSLLVVPAGNRHQLDDQQPSTLLLLCLSPGFLRSERELPALWQDLAGRDQRHLALSRPTQHHLESLWRRALLERINRPRGSLALTRALAIQVLVALARLPVRKPDTAPLARVAAVAREIQATFYDEWDLDRAAARAGVSRRHFSTLFRQTCGRTFWDHLMDLRLTHAAQLLRQGEHSVTGIIFSCGFGDVSQFYRLFRARHGQPPREWAANRRTSATTEGTQFNSPT